jgi:hypothetical protein
MRRPAALPRTASTCCRWLGHRFTLHNAASRTHLGEDVVAQLRVMERHGGAGLLPRGGVHLELPTTVPQRDVNCYDAVGL